MNTNKLFVAIAGFALSAAAFSQQPTCKVETFEGGSQSQGAVAQMVVSNAAARCSITLYGFPRERRNPAESGEITAMPKHGNVEFSAPQVRYMPEKGYVGADEFQFIAYAPGRSGRLLRLKVRVEVNVVP
jgi:hypothetical protein